MTKPKLGQRVTLLEPLPVYGHDYAVLKDGSRLYCIIQPGQIGIVAAVKVPSVRRDGAYFNCIDFMVNGRKERVAARNEQIKAV